MSGCPHFDLTSPETYQAKVPRDVFRYLRTEDPVYWHEEATPAGGFWAVTRQEELDFVSRNPGIFSSSERSSFIHGIKRMPIKFEVV